MRRVILMAQKPLGEECFDYLVKIQTDKFKIVTVVSNMTKNVWWKTNHIYQMSLKQGINFINNETKNEELILENILRLGINIIISVQHSWILSKKILESVNGNAFNLHNAKLPDYKGNNIFSHVILNNENTHTSTIHKMDNEVDMGDIVLEQSIKIHPEETSESLYLRANIIAIELFKKFMDKLSRQDKFKLTKITSKGTFYPKNSLDKLREIKNISNINDVKTKSRAFFFSSFEPAFFKIENKKYYILPENFYKKK